jgi:hTAFII28-like protein conserved region
MEQVVQATTGQLVSQPVAQVLAGVAKVFVGEIVEKGGLVLLCSLLFTPCTNVISSSNTRTTRRIGTFDS